MARYVTVCRLPVNSNTTKTFLRYLPGKYLDKSRLESYSIMCVGRFIPALFKISNKDRDKEEYVITAVEIAGVLFRQVLTFQ